MKYRCPSCQTRNKAKRNDLLKKRPKARCKKCGKQVYIEKWGVLEIMIDLLCEAGGLMIIFSFLGIGALLPSSLSLGEKAVVSGVLTTIVMALYALLLDFVEKKTLKLKTMK